MTNFTKAHIFTARWEGGLVDHPNDPGGITNHGISLRFLQGVDGKTNIDIDLNDDGMVNGEDIRLLTKEDAALLLKEQFWQPLRCDDLPLPLAITTYDSGVNMGINRAVKILQQTCNTITDQLFEGTAERLTVDGKIGPKTLQVCHDIEGARSVVYAAHRAVYNRMQFYRDLVASKPNFEPFLKGWLNRCDALLKHLDDIEQT